MIWILQTFPTVNLGRGLLEGPWAWPILYGRLAVSRNFSGADQFLQDKANIGLTSSLLFDHYFVWSVVTLSFALKVLSVTSE